jgi:hypothetical protein
MIENSEDFRANNLHSAALVNLYPHSQHQYNKNSGGNYGS